MGMEKGVILGGKWKRATSKRKKGRHSGMMFPVFMCLMLVFSGSATWAASPGGLDDASLKLWLKADAISGLANADPVEIWEDQSSNGYDVVKDMGLNPVQYYNDENASPQHIMNYNPSLWFNDGAFTNANRMFGQWSAFHAIVVSSDSRGDLASKRAPLGFGHDILSAGDYPAFDIQFDWYSPTGWDPYMAFWSGEWNGSHKDLHKHRPEILALGGANGNTNLWSHLNGYRQETTLRVNGQVGVGKGIYVGSSGEFIGLDGPWVGNIAEVIVFDKMLGDAEMQKVNSYLAIKYGQTLLFNVAGLMDYVDSDGSVIWAEDATYWNNVAGIGRDDASGLDQRKSKSVLPDALVTIDNGGAFSADKSFLMWGHNGASLGYGNIYDNYIYMNRVWKVSETGTVGEVTVSVPEGAAKYLYVNNTEDFSGGGTFYPLSSGSASVNLADGHFFTFAKDKTAAPGGVVTNLQLWVRADAGTSSAVEDANISRWEDQSPLGHHAVNDGTGQPGQPQYQSDIINGYPALYFEGGTTLGPGPGANRDSLSTENNLGIDGRNEFSLFSVFSAVDEERFSTILGPTGTDGGLQWRVDNAVVVPPNPSRHMRLAKEQQFSIANGNIPAVGAPLLAAVTRSRAAIHGENRISFYMNGGPDNPGGAGWNSDEAFSNTHMRIGDENNDPGGLGSDSTEEAFKGHIAEVVVYNTLVSEADRNKIDSYLALKYGITLPSTMDYIATDGTTVIFRSTSDSAVFTNDIAGIGRDDATALNHPASMSINDDTVVRVEKASPVFKADKTFLAWGNDNASLEGVADVPAGYYQRISRSWYVNEVGETGDLTVSFDVSNVTNPAADTTQPSGFALLVDREGVDFSNATVIDGARINGNTVTFSGVDLQDGDFFYLAYPSSADPTPIAGLSLASNSPVTLGNAIDFQAEVATGSPVDWTWDFDADDGNGTGGSDSNQKDPSHTYANAGAYTVTCTADNDATDPPATATIQVLVSDPVTSVDPQVSKTPATVGETLDFTGNVVGGSDPVFYSWNFDDGSGADTEVASHRFWTAGPYQVGFKAYNGAGERSGTLNVTINDLPPGPSPGGVGDSLKLWLKADAGVTETAGKVSQWDDQSGYSSHAVQPTAANQPDYADAASGINFNPALDFENAEGMYALDIGVETTDSGAIFTVFSEYSLVLAGLRRDGDDRARDPALATQQNELGVVSASPSTDQIVHSTVMEELPTIGMTSWSAGDPDSTQVGFNGDRETQSLNISPGKDFAIGYGFGPIPGTGRIAEAVLYDGELTETEKDRIESYLAIKYGITKAGDYLASDGSTKAWDATANAAYHNDVFGVGRDDESELDHAKSKSVNDSAIVTMDAGSLPNDRSFAIFGNNGGDTNFELAAGNHLHMNRIWKVSETGGVPVTSLCIPDTYNAEVFLLDDDGDFSNGGTTVSDMSDPAGGVQCEDGGVDFTNGQYFTFGISSAPAAPSNGTATPLDKNPVQLAWLDNSTNETGFKVERSPNGTDSWELLDTVGSDEKAYTDNDPALQCDTLYYYRVTATNGAGDSDPTSVFSTKTAPCAPSNLTADPKSLSQIDLAWQDNSDSESRVIIQKSGSDSGPWTDLGTVDDDVVSYTDTGPFACGTTYYYRAIAQRDLNTRSAAKVAATIANSAPSGVASAITRSCIPGDPTDGVARPLNENKIQVGWKDNSDDETGFKVERSPNGTDSWQLIATVGPGEEFHVDDDAALQCGTTYYYRVTATGAGGDSSPTDVFGAKTSPCPPEGLVVDPQGPDQIDLSWIDSSDDESRFVIQRGPGSGGPWTDIATVPAGSQSYTDDDSFSCDNTYCYRIIAQRDVVVNTTRSAGYVNGEPSTPVCGTTSPCPPTGGEAVAVDSHTATVTWTDSSIFETHFVIEYRIKGSGDEWQEVTVPSDDPAGSEGRQSLDIEGLECETEYEFRIEAVGPDGETVRAANSDRAPSDYTDIFTCVTGLCPPSDERSEVASSEGDVLVEFTDNSAGEDHFLLEYGETSGGPYANQETLPGASGVGSTVQTTLTGLACDAVYYARIIAVDSNGLQSVPTAEFEINAGPCEAIPTLGEYGMIFMALLISFSTMIAVAKRRNNES